MAEKKSIFPWVVLGVFVALAVGWFYWFQIRPEHKYSECIEEAETKFRENWDANCKRIGEKPKCSLPPGNAIHYKENRQENLNRCVAAWKN